MNDDQLQDILAGEHPDYPTYTPRDIELMHHTYAMDKIKSVEGYVQELIYMHRYHDRPITVESVEKIHRRLREVISYLS